MTHRAFLEAFAEVFARLSARPECVSGYKDAKSWTPFMLGADAGSVLGGAATLFATRTGSSDHSLHEQWYSLDLVAVSPGYRDARDYWQTRTILTVEHENGYDVETEMWKLAHWRSPLSVLVFYDFNEADQTDRLVTVDRTTRGVTQRDWLAAKLQLLTEIVRAVDEPEASRHLLLIGCRDLAGAIVWRQSVARSSIRSACAAGPIRHTGKIEELAGITRKKTKG